ncbi:MAG: hypothetical protein JRI97_06645 [Deltaproteobacteria bacterium]|nr:hypothetical protein [Deltaproteobacteria bacterium]
MNRALRLSKLAFTPAALAFLGIMALRNREVILDLLARLTLRPVAVALVLWTGLHFLSALVAFLVFRSSNAPLSFGQAFFIHANRLPARYIPGGIWHTVGRVADYVSLGISKAHIVLFVFLGNALAPCMTFLLGGLAVAAAGRLPVELGLAAAGGGLLGMTAIPLVVRIRLLRGRIVLPVVSYGAILGVMGAFWCGAATCFTLYFLAFPETTGKAWEVGGAYLFSWGVGFLTFFAPQGIGVFETVSGKLLEGGLTLGSTAVLAAGFRVVILAADLLAFSTAHLFFRPRGGKGP